MNKTCETCEWWKDYTDRFYANIAGVRGDIARGKIELRKCRYVPPPAIDQAAIVYTDKHFSCSAWACVTKDS